MASGYQSAELWITVHKWLKELGIRLPKAYIQEELTTHPDYPSLLSITDTLDEWAIPNAALVVDKDRKNELPLPFLAHYTENGGSFIVVTDWRKLLKKYPDFNKAWDGIAVLAEKQDVWEHKLNEEALRKERRTNRLLSSGIVLMLLLAFTAFYYNSEILRIALFFTAIAGLAVSVLILQKELGIYNSFTEDLCHTGKNSDCDAVINKTAKDNPDGWQWSDAGIIYFSALLFLSVSALPITVLAIPVSLALPFTIYSLWYQRQVARKWCPLCLFTMAVLWGQGFVALPLWKGGQFSDFSITALSTAAFIFLAVALLWLLVIKPLLNSNKKLKEKNYTLLRFKNDAEVFAALLEKQRRVDATPFEYDLQIGNAAAPVQLMVACNPYCGPCAKTHEVLDELLDKNDIGITVRFNVNATEPEDIRTKAVAHILQWLHENNDYQETRKKILHDWFAWMDFEKFAEKYSLQSGPDVSTALGRHEAWTNEAGIKFSPTIFINGMELPKQYRVKDLHHVLRKENAESIEEQKNENKKARQVLAV